MHYYTYLSHSLQILLSLARKSSLGLYLFAYLLFISMEKCLSFIQKEFRRANATIRKVINMAFHFQHPLKFLMVGISISHSLSDTPGNFFFFTLHIFVTLKKQIAFKKYFNRGYRERKRECMIAFYPYFVYSAMF